VLAEIRVLAPAAGRHHDHGLWHGGERGARHAIRSHNFIQKAVGQRKNCWPTCVRPSLARKRKKKTFQLKRALSKQRYNFEHIVGKSEPMLKIFDLVAQVAPSRSTVLLQGEAGRARS